MAELASVLKYSASSGKVFSHANPTFFSSSRFVPLAVSIRRNQSRFLFVELEVSDQFQLQRVGSMDKFHVSYSANRYSKSIFRGTRRRFEAPRARTSRNKRNHTTRVDERVDCRADKFSTPSWVYVPVKLCPGNKSLNARRPAYYDAQTFARLYSRVRARLESSQCHTPLGTGKRIMSCELKFRLANDR